MGDKNKGLYKKFHVERNDGNSRPGKKHYACEYFVLDLTHDLHALPAIRAYAVSCATDYPQLALEVLQLALECAEVRGETPGPEPVCIVCGMDWDAATADEQCTYPECPYLGGKQQPGDITRQDARLQDAAFLLRVAENHGTHVGAERLRSIADRLVAPPVVETQIVMQEVYEGYLAYIVECLNEVGDGGLVRVHPVLEFREWKAAQAEEGS